MLTYGQNILTSSPCSRASKMAENDDARTWASPSSMVCTAAVWESSVVTFCSTLIARPKSPPLWATPYTSGICDACGCEPSTMRSDSPVTGSAAQAGPVPPAIVIAVTVPTTMRHVARLRFLRDMAPSFLVDVELDPCLGRRDGTAS